MAEEFRVSPGAIAHWESGARSVPGPILRLIEIYEEHLCKLETEPAPSARESKLDFEFDSLSRRMTDAVFTVVRGRKSPHVAAQRNVLHRGLRLYLKRHLLKTDSLARNIRLALIEQLVSAVGSIHGLPMKLAQVASYMDPTISPEIRDVLASLQDHARSLPAAEADRIIEKELGARPRQLFAEWAPKPFAAASLGQVHRARLKTGECVAVKIQYPGIAEKVDNHFKALVFINTFRNLIGNNDGRVFSEIRDRVLEECDYRLEAENQDCFRQIFASDPSVLVPRVYHEHSTSRVLTTEYIAGEPLASFKHRASEVERNRAGETMVRFYSESIFSHRMLHADPHPGNYLFLQDKVCFLDFGRTKRLTDDDATFNKSLYKAILTDDSAAARELLTKYNMVKDWAKLDFEGFWRAVRAQEHHHIVEGQFRFTRDYVASQIAAAKSFRGWRELRINAAGLWAICINASLWNILAELEAESNWRQSGLLYVL